MTKPTRRRRSRPTQRSFPYGLLSNETTRYRWFKSHWRENSLRYRLHESDYPSRPPLVSIWMTLHRQTLARPRQREDANILYPSSSGEGPCSHSQALAAITGSHFHNRRPSVDAHKQSHHPRKYIPTPLLATTNTNL
jgi:hypothetical protein